MRRSAAVGTVVLCLFLLPAAGTFAATPELQQAILDDGPVLYYQLAETTGNAINLGSLGNTHDASYQGTPVRGVAGYGGEGAVRLKDANDYLESLAVAPAGLTGNPVFSIEVVVRADHDTAALQYGPFLHWGTAADGAAVFFGFSRSLANQSFSGFYNGGLVMPIGAMPAGYWYHVVWVRAGGPGVAANAGTTVYLDGVDVTSSLVEDPTLSCNACLPNIVAGVFQINRAADLLGVRQFQGHLDEVALYDRELTPSEIVEHYMALTEVFADGFESGDTMEWTSAVP